MTAVDERPVTAKFGAGPACRVLRLQRRAPLLQITVLAGLFIYALITIPGIDSTSSIDSLLVLAALVGMAALGQTIVIIIGAIDLSVSGYIVAGAITITQLSGVHGWPPVAAIAFVAVCTGALGAATGWVCHRFEIQPMVLTLGAGSLAAGAAIGWSKGIVTGAAPVFLTKLSMPISHTFSLRVPPVVAIWIVLIIVLAVFMHRTTFGRRLYATGANPAAAELALIRTRRVWVGVFAFSALASTLVGVLLAGFAGADQSVGEPYLWQGLTAVVIGGTTFMGARGDYTHTAVGALILSVLTTILVGKGLDTSDQEIVFGLLILIGVAGYGRDRRLRDRI
jgi:ribose transport system permease protein